MRSIYFLSERKNLNYKEIAEFAKKNGFQTWAHSFLQWDLGRKLRLANEKILAIEMPKWCSLALKGKKDCKMSARELMRGKVSWIIFAENDSEWWTNLQIRAVLYNRNAQMNHYQPKIAILCWLSIKI